MNKLLWPIRNNARCYIDDIVVATYSWEQHMTERERPCTGCMAAPFMFNFWLFSYFASLAILSAPSSIVLKTIGMFLLYYLHRTLIGKTCFNLLLTGNESEVVGAALTSQKNGHTH
jgi:hypothetical protein